MEKRKGAEEGRIARRSPVIFLRRRVMQENGGRSVENVRPAMHPSSCRGEGERCKKFH